MSHPYKHKRMDMGKKTLAGILLNLAAHSHKTNDLMEQRIGRPKENIQRFKQKGSSSHYLHDFGDRCQNGGCVE